MLTYAIDNPAPATIIMITGDRDFAYAMSVLRVRHYEVILVTLSNAHYTLTAQASRCLDWVNDVLKATQPVKSSNDIASSLPASIPNREDTPPRKRLLSNQSVQTGGYADEVQDRRNQVDLLQYLRGASSTRFRPTSVSLHRPECLSQYAERPPHVNNVAERIDQVSTRTSADMTSNEPSCSSSKQSFTLVSVGNAIRNEDHNGSSEPSDPTTLKPSTLQINQPIPTTFESVRDHEMDATEDVSDVESYFSCVTQLASHPHTLLASLVQPPAMDIQGVESFESEAPSTVVDYPREEPLVDSTELNQTTVQEVHTKLEEDNSHNFLSCMVNPSPSNSNTRDPSIVISAVGDLPDDSNPLTSNSFTPTVVHSAPSAAVIDSNGYPPYIAATASQSVSTPSTPPLASLYPNNSKANYTSFLSTVKTHSDLPTVDAGATISSSTLSIRPTPGSAALYPINASPISPFAHSTQSTVAIPSFSTLVPSSISTQPRQMAVANLPGPSPESSVSKLTGKNVIFQPLVDVLYEGRETFPKGCSRTYLGEELVKKDPNVYLRANVDKFREYIAAAIDAGIVNENKDDPFDSTIFLLDQYAFPHQLTKLDVDLFTPTEATQKITAIPIQKPTSTPTTAAAQTKPKLTGTNTRFQILVDVLHEIRHKYPNDGAVPRSDLAPFLIAKNPHAYTKFKTYISAAIETGIVCEKRKKSIALTDMYA